jgi:hypothetical protein
MWRILSLNESFTQHKDDTPLFSTPPSTTIGYTSSDLSGLRWQEDTFDHVRLGSMADAECLSDDGDESDLFVEAMNDTDSD